MRERFVWQVLGATLGCGLLLVLIGIIDAPKDASEPVMAAPHAASSALDQNQKPTAAKDERPRSSGDFSDECEYPSCDTTDKMQPPPKKDCV